MSTVVASALELFFFLSGLLGVVIGGAVKTVAEEDRNLHRISDQLMVVGVMALAFAVFTGKTL